MLPLALGVAMLVLQVGAVAYGASSAQEAAREAARAFSLGQDPAAAARGALPQGYTVTALDRLAGAGHGIRITVQVPRVTPLPAFTLTREAVLP
jgi:Xaa-Pro aminopeptidase